MKLKKLYKLARQEDEIAISLLQHNMLDNHSAIIARRNALMDAIYVHPENKFSRRAISSQIITGLSGNEDELK